MFPSHFRTTDIPNDLNRHLGDNLLELLRNEVDTIEVVDAASKNHLHFIRVARMSAKLGAKISELYIADVEIADIAGKRELYYTLYDLKTAPLDTARCPRELTARLTVINQEPRMLAWLEANNAYNDAVEEMATLLVGNVVFVPAGMQLSEGREFFLRSTSDDGYTAIPEDGRNRASTCLVTRENLVDYHNARKVTLSKLQPVLDPRVRASMREHGVYLIRPSAANPDIYEIAGRVPTLKEQEKYQQSRRFDVAAESLGRRQGAGKLLFL